MNDQGLIHKWVKQAEKEGWKVVRTKRHYRLFPVDKTKPPITLATSPGGGRGMLNCQADLRRAGLDVEI